MKRRRFIGTLSAAMVSVGLPGCQGGGDDYPEGVDPEEAQEQYEDALDALVENTEILDDWAEGRPGRDQQTIETLANNVDSARESLDSAEDVAPEEMTTQIEGARDIAAFHAELLDFYELRIEFEETRTDASTFGDDEQHERAVEEYEAAREVLDEAGSQLDDVQAAYERLDSVSLDDPDLDYSGEYTQHVAVEGSGSIDVQGLNIDGWLNVHQIFVEVNTGFDRYENEEFVAARERFTAGEEARQRAEEAFGAVQEHENAWTDLRDEAIQFLGIVEELAEALELFIEATHEAEAGNHQEANEMAEEGFFVIDQAFQ